MNEALIDPLQATENAFVLLCEALMTSCCTIYSSLFFHVLSMNFDWWLYSIVFWDKVFILHSSVKFFRQFDLLALIERWRESINCRTHLFTDNLCRGISYSPSHVRFCQAHVRSTESAFILFSNNTHRSFGYAMSVHLTLKSRSYLHSLRRLDSLWSHHLDWFHVRFINIVAFVFELLLPAKPALRHPHLILADTRVTHRPYSQAKLINKLSQLTVSPEGLELVIVLRWSCSQSVHLIWACFCVVAVDRWVFEWNLIETRILRFCHSSAYL